MKARTVAAAVALVLSATLVGAVAVSYTPVSGTITLQTNTGVSVSTADHGGDMAFNDPFVDDSTVRVVTQNGNVTVSGGSSASLYVAGFGSGVTVEDLAAGSTTLTVDSETGDALDINGSAATLAWETVEPDDGSADVTASFGSGESATVTFDGLDPNTDYKLIDGSGTRVAVGTSDGSGTEAFTLTSNTTYELQSYDNPLPTVTNLSPNDQLVEDSVTLNATIDDDCLPGCSVDVVYRVNGNTVESDSVASAGEQSYMLTQSELPGPGRHDWSVTATDNLGGETTATASFSIAGNMTVRNVSDGDEVIPGAEATFYLDNGTMNRTADANGNVSLSGLPGGTRIPVDINATDYRERTMLIPSVVQAGDAYLIPENETVVLNRFTLTDATGSYGSDTSIILTRPVRVNGTSDFRQVAGDRAGVEGFSATLVQDQRYRVVLKSDDGKVARLGKYVATTSQEVPLRPDAVTVQVGSESVVGYNASVDDSGTLELQYYDPTGETDVLTLYVVNRFNSSDYLLEPSTYYSTNSLTLTEPVGELNSSYIAVIEGQRNGSTFRATIPLGPDQRNLVPPGLSLPWIQFAGIGLLLLVGGAFSRLNVGAGVVVTSTMAGVLWYIGLLQGVATWATVAVAITFSVIYAMVIQ
jgi:hypothetical protein